MRNDQRTGMKVTMVRAVVGSTAASLSVDGANYRFAVFHVMFNASGAGKTVSVQIQDSDDNVNFTNFGSAFTLAGATADASGMVLVGHQAVRRYVRAFITPASSSQTACVVWQYNELVTPDSASNVTLAVL